MAMRTCGEPACCIWGRRWSAPGCWPGGDCRSRWGCRLQPWDPPAFCCQNPARVPAAAFLYPIGRFALLGRAGGLSVVPDEKRFAGGEGAQRGLSLRDRGVDRIGHGHRHGTEPASCAGGVRGGGCGPLPGAMAVGCDGFGAFRSIGPDPGIGCGRGAGDCIRHHAVVRPPIRPFANVLGDYRGGTRPPRLHRRRVHQLPFAIRAAQYGRRGDVGARRRTSRRFTASIRR